MTPEIDAQLLDVLLSLQLALGRVSRVTHGRSLSDMRESELLQLAITKAVEQVGEISGRILRKFPAFAVAHPELKFSLAYGARNRFAHAYEEVDFDAVWLSATVSVVEMNKNLAGLLADVHGRP